MTRITGHCNEQLPKLHNEVVLIGLELPANPFCRWGSQLEGKPFQPLGHSLVL
jgi:hypothetical protein